MHFSVCRNKKVLSGCPQGPHGHLWIDDEETKKIVVMRPMTTKKEAREAVSEMMFLGRERAHKALVSMFKAQIDASSLPEDEWSKLRQGKKPTHLKLVK